MMDLDVNAPTKVTPRPGRERTLAEKTIYENRALLAPLPNLFKSTFEHAGRSGAGERWLQQKIEAWDMAGKAKGKRKEILEEFLSFLSSEASLGARSGLEALFAGQAHFFLARVGTWFAVMLPTCYELKLQLKVLFAFLAYGEQVFVRAFFESGIVISLMNALSVEYHVPDDVRCLVLILLQRLAKNGRCHKEMLCNQGITEHVLDCAADALRWETLRCSGQLLCELFHSNPKHQPKLLDALQDIMQHRQPLAQRIAVGSIASLLLAGGLPKSRAKDLSVLCLRVLASPDLKACSDAYSLACHLIRHFDCDELFYDFARKQLLSLIAVSIDEWIAMEEEDGHLTVGAESRHAHLSRRMEIRAQDKASSNIHEETSYLLTFGLMLFLAKRSTRFCEELVDLGITEALLRGVLDPLQPIRQAGALTDLIELQVISRRAQQRAEAILVKRDFLTALTIEAFMAAGDADDFARARFRLRNMWQKQKKEMRLLHRAEEHLLQQRLLDLRINKVGPKVAKTEDPPSSLFITESNTEATEPADPRVRRLALAPDQTSVRAARDTERGYRIDRSYLQECIEKFPVAPPAEPLAMRLGTLFSDPLSIDAESPLLQELLDFEESLGPRRRPPAGSSRPPFLRLPLERIRQTQPKTLPPISEEAKKLLRRDSDFSVANVSMYCSASIDGGPFSQCSACTDACGYCSFCTSTDSVQRSRVLKVKQSHGISMAETSLDSAEAFEFEAQSLEVSEQDDLAAGFSMSRVEEDESNEVVVMRSSLMTLVEAPGKRMLHIQPAPYHKCIAFASRKGSTEEMKDPSLAKKQLFQELQLAGKFPRRSVRSRGPNSAREARPPRKLLLSEASCLLSDTSGAFSSKVGFRVFGGAEILKLSSTPWKRDQSTIQAENLSLIGFFPASARAQID